MAEYSNQVKHVTKEPVTYLVFNRWETDEQLIHCFTTRLGGVSEDYLSSLNLGFNRGDQKQNVIENYQRVCRVLGVSLGSVVLSKQVHETQIMKVNQKDAGSGILFESRWENADGLYTRERGVTLVTHYADCVPLLFYAPSYGIIGMTHAGWRGTVKEISRKMIEIWHQKEGVPLTAIQVAIGPSIGPCCFEVNQDVADAFTGQFGKQSFIHAGLNTDKYHINLWEANRYVLRSAGIKEENILSADLCTSCHDHLYFSHRKTQGKRGTQGAFMALK